MITITDLSKKYRKVEAVKNVTVSFSPGEVVALIGPNGSGKTTLIKSILGLIYPDSGDIIIDKEPILKNYDYKKKIGYMPQIGRYPDNISIEHLLKMLRNIRNYKESQTDNDLIDKYGLMQIADKTMRTLSGGTRQKVSATIAFLFNPPILILDEPTAGLDPVSSEILKEKIIAEKNKNKLIIITSHILSDLDEITSKVCYMTDGNMIFNKKIEDIKIDTGEQRLEKAIASIIKKYKNY